MDSIEKAIVEKGLHKRAHDIRVNEIMMRTQEKVISMVKDTCDVGSVVKERREIESEKQNKISISHNDTRVEDADIRFSNETEPMDEVQSTAVDNVFANDRQHAEQPKFINERGVDHDAEQRENICENAKCELQTKIIELEKVDDSKAEKDQFLKEINHLRAQLENLKGKSVETKFDKPSILGKPHVDKLLINSQISKSWFTPKVVLQKDFSKPITA
nr:Gag-Pol polyprotein [Tanacetum cinerariifolium]